MTRHRETPQTAENPRDLELSETMRNQIKTLLQDKLKKLNPESFASVGGFFSSLRFVDLTHNGHDPKVVANWNIWIDSWKGTCIGKVRGNAVKPPKIHTDKLEEFFNECRRMGLIEGTTKITAETNTRVDQVLEVINPT